MFPISSVATPEFYIAMTLSVIGSYIIISYKILYGIQLRRGARGRLKNVAVGVYHY